MESSDKLTDSKAIIEFLSKTFPACFTLKQDPKPLKVGIFKDLVEQLSDNETISKTQLRHALRRYTSSWRYLSSLEKGGNRVDLQGKECEDLENEHIEYAKKTLKESKDKVAKKKQELKKSNKGNKPNNTQQSHSDRKKFPQKSSTPDGKTTTSNPNQHHKRNKGIANKTVQVRKKRSFKPTLEAMGLVQLDKSLLKIGKEVKVKLGQTPIDGIIKDIGREEVQVQLDGGVTIKTNVENLYSA